MFQTWREIVTLEFSSVLFCSGRSRVSGFPPVDQCGSNEDYERERTVALEFSVLFQNKQDI